MVGPSAVSANALSGEVGVSQASLSRWLREAGTVAVMTPSTKHGQAPGKRKWTAREKFRAVVEAATLSEQDLGGFLRREGLHEAEVQRWREAAEAALGGVSRQRPQKTVDAKRMKALERERCATTKPSCS